MGFKESDNSKGQGKTVKSRQKRKKVVHEIVSQDEATRGMKWARMKYLRAEGNKLWKEGTVLRDKAGLLWDESEEIDRELSKP